MTISRLCFVGLLFAVVPCVGQQSLPDTAFLSSARKSQIDLYASLIKGQTRLNNGSEYRDYLARNDEHPYFGIDDWAYGTIVYDDEFYENVAMFYDLSRDKIITEHSLNGAKLELISEKIQRFTMSKHTFVRLYPDKAKVITEGFYELLYDGKTKVYARREKFLQQNVGSNTIVLTFEQKDKLYIFKDGIYYPVKSKDSVIEVFADKKQEIKAFMKKSGTKFKSDRESAIAGLASFYDTQNN
jgi:hypothetical protein